MKFPFSFDIDGYVADLPDDIVDVFRNTLIVEVRRPIINGRETDVPTWNIIKKIINSRCMICFPVHYPALYIRLHSNNKSSRRAVCMFNDIMAKIKNKGCPCECHIIGR